jgi:hypothetical protein
VPLATWRARIRDQVPVAGLLGAGFRKLPENEAYPRAGLLVEDLVEEVGIATLRDHLYPATAATWADACRRAGCTRR